MLNKCLDRFEHVDENAQPGLDLPDASTSNLLQSSSPEPLAIVSPPPTLSPPPVEMPPLLNQPHWHYPDKPEGQADSSPSPSPGSTPIAGTPTILEQLVPFRPKLTIPTRSISEGSRVLITDDNAINRRVSHFADQSTTSFSLICRSYS